MSGIQTNRRAAARPGTSRQACFLFGHAGRSVGWVSDVAACLSSDRLPDRLRRCCCCWRPGRIWRTLHIADGLSLAIVALFVVWALGRLRGRHLLLAQTSALAAACAVGVFGVGALAFACGAPGRRRREAAGGGSSLFAGPGSDARLRDRDRAGRRACWASPSWPVRRSGRRPAVRPATARCGRACAAACPTARRSPPAACGSPLHWRSDVTQRGSVMNSKRIVFLLLAVIVAGTTAFLARAWLQAERAAIAAQIGRRAAEPRRPSPRCRCWWRATRCARASSSSPKTCAGRPGRRARCRRPISSKASGRSPNFVGAVARNPLHVGQPVVETDIVMPGSRGFLAAVLQPGLRAVSVPATATTAVSGFIYAGDRVDVLLTHTLNGPQRPAQRDRDDPAQRPRHRHGPEARLRAGRQARRRQDRNAGAHGQADRDRDAGGEDGRSVAGRCAACRTSMRRTASPANADDATAELGNSFTHDTQVSRLIKSACTAQAARSRQARRSSCCAAASRAKQDIDGSVSSDPDAPQEPDVAKPNAAPKDNPVHPHLAECAAMNPSFAPSRPSPWRRAGSWRRSRRRCCLRSSPRCAGAGADERPRQGSAQDQAAAAAQEGGRRTTPTDNVSDDLNRRESRARRDAHAFAECAGLQRRPCSTALPIDSQPVEEGPSRPDRPIAAADGRRHSAARADHTGCADAGRRSSTPTVRPPHRRRRVDARR